VPGEGLGAIATTKRSRRQIEDLCGLAIAVTAEDVDVRDLSPDGSYHRKTPGLAGADLALTLP